jgi:hypothetical protein
LGRWLLVQLIRHSHLGAVNGKSLPLLNNGASVILTSTIGIRVNTIIDRYMEIVRDQVGQDGRRQFVSPQAS